MKFKKTGMHELRIHAHNGLHITTIYGIAGANITLDAGNFNENGISTFEIYEPDGNLFAWSELNEIGLPSSGDCTTLFKVRITPSYYNEVLSIDDLIEPCEVVCCDDDEEFEITFIHQYIPNNRPPIDNWFASLDNEEYCDNTQNIRWTYPDGRQEDCKNRILLPENGTYTIEVYCPETGCIIEQTFEFNEI